ncbi:R3H domain-containing nucleic acid-binding protein [Rathayibacter sp. VKM Ac-2926]|uniref:Jag family protein n=1 Tax=Rathayibacter sp. VKM Ac-2926 TaxID=2929477 RepID=UPI001FB47B28|nr:R3H domain-containing nucleic acid-binding protein [Rathayibacter sp. VKM Ac-2926]MCJ1705850.1 DNA-binding protein [Rathayibacter sp. VKM Ac-2926]
MTDSTQMFTGAPAAPDAQAPADEELARRASSADGGAAPTLSQLEEEGDVAADYIEEFLDICDLDGDIDIEVRNGRAYLSVTASGDTNLRVLSRPDAVQALQELTRLAVQTKTGGFSRLILDIGGSRDAREAELAQLVDRAIERIEEGATSASLPPMSSYERKLVHDMVGERGFVSESRGEARERHTVITRG